MLKLMELLKLNLDGQRIEVGTMAAISSLPGLKYLIKKPNFLK